MSTLTLDILARDRASKTLKDVGKASDQASKKMSSGFGAIGKFAGVAALGVGALAGAGVMMGIKTAASLEQAQIGFTTLLGSATKAGTYVKDLQKFAANTPFEFQGLVDSSRLLLGVGVASQKVIPMLTDFGDAAGALGIQQDAFQRIMLASSQAISAGKFQVGDINQIVQNGIPVWSLLSKSLGKPVTELRKMASTGKLTADVVLPALQRQMHKDYGGSMAKQSQTLAGLWSTFTDTLSQGLAQAIMPLVPMLKTILPGAMSVMGAALAGVAKAFAFVFNAVQIFVAGFGNNTDQLVAMNVKWTNPVVNAGFKVRDMFNKILPSIKALANWVKGSLVPALMQLGRQVLPAVRDLFQTVAKAIHNNREAFRILGAVLTNVVLPVLGFLTKVAIRSIILQITVLSTVIKAVVVPAVKILASVFLAVFGLIINGAAKAFGWIKGIGGPLKRAAAEFNKFRDSVVATLNGTPHSFTFTAYYKAVGSSKLTNQGKKNATEVRGFGGPVRAGTPYIVGERRAELFVPDSNGRIVPKVPTSSGGGGGGTTNNFYITGALDPNAVGDQILAILQKKANRTGPLQLKIRTT